MKNPLRAQLPHILFCNLLKTGKSSASVVAVVRKPVRSNWLCGKLLVLYISRNRNRRANGLLGSDRKSSYANKNQRKRQSLCQFHFPAASPSEDFIKTSPSAPTSNPFSSITRKEILAILFAVFISL